MKARTGYSGIVVISIVLMLTASFYAASGVIPSKSETVLERDRGVDQTSSGVQDRGHAIDNTNETLSAGDFHTCFIPDDGTLKCWGSDLLTNGPDHTSATNVYLGEGRFAQSVSAGGKHTCVLLDGGTVSCFGENYHGQIGGEEVGVYPDLGLTDIELGEGGPAISVIGGDQHTCILLENHSVFCFGSNSYGQLGVSTNYHCCDETPPVTLNNSSFVDLTSHVVYNGSILPIDEPSPPVAIDGFRSTCVILANKSVMCWGVSPSVLMGGSTNNGVYNPLFYTYNLGDGQGTIPITNAVKMSVGLFSCFILGDEVVAGEYFDNVSTNLVCGETSGSYYEAAEPVNLGDRTATSVASGNRHTCVILDDGGVRCWGDNEYGQLGDATKIDKDVPTNVTLPEGRTAVEITAGQEHTCVLLDNDSVMCWGHNNNGQVGDGTLIDRSSPRYVNFIEPDSDSDGWTDSQELLCGSAYDDWNSVPLDTDQDGSCDEIDSDDDNDGWSDIDEEECGTDPLGPSSAPYDHDGDGICNFIDDDDDNDMALDINDAFPLNPCAQLDTDNDGQPNEISYEFCIFIPGEILIVDDDDDGDGRLDLWDDFPLDSSEWVDTDGDGIGNNADHDDDNDGLSDFQEEFDSDPWPTDPLDFDTDDDGLGDGVDLYPRDFDNDGTPDWLDVCWGHPDDVDEDNDGISDGCDDIVDSDNDGVPNDIDQCWGFDDLIDSDEDGLVDGCEDFRDIDSDHDGIYDLADKCAPPPGAHPSVGDDNIDQDSDGVPDGCDILIDSDRDGVSDFDENCEGYDDLVDVDDDDVPDGCDYWFPRPQHTEILTKMTVYSVIWTLVLLGVLPRRLY